MSGELKIRSAKNSILPIIACCVMTKKTVVLKNCPPLLDIYAMLDIIESIGGKTSFCGDVITINCADVTPAQIDKKLTQGIRASVFILGPILARFNKAVVSYPGGCEIGKRPIDLHLDGLSALGVRTITENDVINCDGSEMRGGEITLRFPSVGATENIMMAAVLTSGTTIINNAAREPEIEDLASFINAIGGRVYGAGSSSIIVEGVKKLGGCEYTPIPDRIVAGTYLAAVAMCGGKIKLNNINIGHTYAVIDKLQAAGCRFNYKKDSVIMSSGERLLAIPKTCTMPYPGFPTDMQAQFTSMLSVADGQSVITENLFENRFRYAGQLKKMGADIELNGTTALINGVAGLKGAVVEAQDLRGGAALVLAGLAASGSTSVYGVEHIDRGYYKIEDDLMALNGDIVRKEN